MDLEKINNAREFLSHALLSVAEIGKILNISSDKLLNTKVVYADLSNVDSVIKANEKIQKIISLAKGKLEEVGIQSMKDLNELLTALDYNTTKLTNGDSNESEIPHALMEPETILTEDIDKNDEQDTTEPPEVNKNGFEKEKTPDKEQKSFIKVIDINKLMEPKTNNDSVIVLSDSEISSPEKQKNPIDKKINEIYKSDQKFKPKQSFVNLSTIPNNLDKVMVKNSIKKLFDDKGELLKEIRTTPKRNRSTKELAKSKFASFRLKHSKDERSNLETKPKESDDEPEQETEDTVYSIPEFEGVEKLDIKSSLKDIASPKLNKRVSFAKNTSASNTSNNSSNNEDKTNQNSNEEKENTPEKKNRLSVSKRNKKSSLRQSKDGAESSSDSELDGLIDDNVVVKEKVVGDDADKEIQSEVGDGNEEKKPDDENDDETVSCNDVADKEKSQDDEDAADCKEVEEKKKKRSLDKSDSDTIEEKKRKCATSDDEIDKLTDLKSLEKKSKSTNQSKTRSKSKKDKTKSSDEKNEDEKTSSKDESIGDDDANNDDDEGDEDIAIPQPPTGGDFNKSALSEAIVDDILNSGGDEESAADEEDEGEEGNEKKKAAMRKPCPRSKRGSPKKKIERDPLLTDKLSGLDSDDEKKSTKKKRSEEEGENSDKGSFKTGKKRSQNKNEDLSDDDDSDDNDGSDGEKIQDGEEKKEKCDDETENVAEKMDEDEPPSKNNDDDESKGSDGEKAKDDDDGDSDDSIIKPVKVKGGDSDEDDEDEDEKNSGSSDSDVLVTKRKRKVKRKDSDDSDKSSDSDKKSKRKRVKRIKNSDDSSAAGSGSDENSPNKGRKNIRKVIKTKNLDEATVQAAKEEKERKQRIEERQRLYNSLYDDKHMKESKVDKLVLDFDPETKEELITVHKKLVKHLKPHQATGVKFMFDACFESVKQIEKGYGSGCILAHCMGLGKSLQVVTLVHTLLTHYEQSKVRCVLVVCPLSTVLNWVNEFTIWLKNINDGEDLNIFEISKFKQNNERARHLQYWQESGGVMIMGYDMFRNLSNEKGARLRKKMKESLQKSLVNPGPDLIICDEGHLLKNEKTSLSQAITRIKTSRRIVLTGTPVQNNLKEYYCMVQFVKPNLLGKYTEYMNRFVNPITNGQYTDSTPRDIAIMKRRSHVLHKMLDGCVQRKDYSVLAPFLPPKHEYVLFINLTELQIKLYQFYLDNFARRMGPDRKNSSFLFPDFQNFQRIWTHPRVLKANSERYERDQAKKAEKDTDSEGSLKDFIDDSNTSESDTSESSNESEDSDEKANARKNANAAARNTRASRRAGTFIEEDEPLVMLENEEKKENPTEWWMPLCPEEELDYLKHSGKLMLLFEILKECEAIGDKILVFSQSLYSLDVIEHFLSQIDERTQNTAADEEEEEEDEEKRKEKKLKDPLLGHRGSWSLGLDYFRLDGSTSCENRAAWCKSFNRADNLRSRLFLISTRAGGLGINLVAANRVIIFDVSWNPSHDVQSIFRVYRFGQKKPCYIYRFIARGTMEEKVYERQVTKQAISKRVIDEQQIDRHYNSNDLNELYKFEPIPAEPRPTPKLPKDRLFAELLHGHEKLIYHFHEHDSLLENKEEETLNEDERKAAWEEFENEKKAPPPQMMYQQQQQQYSGKGNFGTGSNLFGIPMNMVLSLLTLMVKQDNPVLTDDEVKMVIPTMSQKMIAATQAGDFTLVERMKRLWVQQQNMYLQQQYNNVPYKSQQYPGMMQNQNHMLMQQQQQQQQMLYKQQQQQQLLKQQQLQSQQNMLNQQAARMINPYNKTHNQLLQQQQQPQSAAKNSNLVPNPIALSKNRKLPTMQDFVDLDSD